jgi:hypothetical protein
MKPHRSLRALAAATPLAVATLLAAAPQASAGISDAALNNPHVLEHGAKLSVEFSSAISDSAADAATARKVADSLVGTWAGDLVDEAMRNAPASTSTCRVAATAIDPDGAAGTVSAAIPAGVANTELDIPDQTPGTTWGAGDLDHFTVQLTCTDTQRGNVSRTVLDEDQTAAL